MKGQSYNAFWQRIHQAARTKAFPLRVMFELTYRCNFKCRHCYVPYSYRKNGELKTKDVFSILKQLKDIGCFYLGFTGGEPFIRKDIMDILWYAKKIGFELIIYTNGSLINEAVAKELQQLRPNKVDITIPAMSKHAFEQITQLGGSYKKVFRTIDLLHKKGVNLGFKTCVLKESEGEIKEIQDFSHSLGALHRLDDILSPCLDGSREPYRYRGVLKENLVARRTPHAARRTPQAIDDACYVKPDTKELFRCGVGISQVAITPQGELKMCLMIDYPKYKILNKKVVSRKSYVVCRKSGLQEAWEKLKELVGSIKPDENYQCDRCKLYAYCKWCPARGWLYNKKFTSCAPENLRKAELISID